ncbi:MAG: hypothetical protein K6B45_04785 [Bacteroidaceae bacterium]|nr:hypothetical protein [Bacteroidaceae bacterium]
MTTLEKLNQWLREPQRNYAEGLVLFDRLANKELVERYGVYFHSVAAVPAGAQHMTLLVAKLQRIAENISLNPLPYQQVLQAEYVSPSKPAATPAQPAPNAKDEAPAYIELAGGTKKFLEGDLPEEMSAKYGRIKELVPLMARLHADLSHAEGEEAATIADELCKLDDERRQLWDELDDWASDKDGSSTDDAGMQRSDVAKGIELTRNLKRLNDNIRTNRKAAEKYQAEGNAEAAAKALERLARYEQELADLEKQIADEEAAS